MGREIVRSREEEGKGREQKSKVRNSGSGREGPSLVNPKK